MMKIRFLFTLSLIFVLQSCSKMKCPCIEHNCSDNIRPISYNEVLHIVSKISNDYKFNGNDIELSFTLMGKENFKYLIDKPCIYKESLLKILQDQSVQHRDKLVALFGLQHICIKNYIKVIQVIFQEYKKGQLNKEFLKLSILQEFSLEVSRNYGYKPLIVLLKDIKLFLKDQGQDAEYIDEILSGNSWNSLIEYYRDSGEGYNIWFCKYP